MGTFRLPHTGLRGADEGALGLPWGNARAEGVAPAPGLRRLKCLPGVSGHLGSGREASLGCPPLPRGRAGGRDGQPGAGVQTSRGEVAVRESGVRPAGGPRVGSTPGVGPGGWVMTDCGAAPPPPPGLTAPLGPGNFPAVEGGTERQAPPRHVGSSVEAPSLPTSDRVLSRWSCEGF